MGSIGRMGRLLWTTNSLQQTLLSVMSDLREGSVPKGWQIVRRSIASSSHTRKIGSSHSLSGGQVIQDSKKSPETPLLKQLIARIKFSGPLTVHDYMKEVLINPLAGYYSAGKDMFGSHGDYITSPEICQMFGELVGVWIYNEWCKLGSPKPLQLIELGPGRGTFMQDILKVLNQLNVSGKELSVQLVEVSEELSQKQEEKLCGKVIFDKDACEEELYYKKSITTTGSPIFWHRHLSTIPKSFSVFLANEFFDVLPVHKIRRTENGWREVLIDIDDGDGPHHLRYVLSRAATPAAKVFIQPEETRDEVEVSPEAAVLCGEMANRIEEDGGISLIIDYGYDGKVSNTFRGFRNHVLHDPLCEPGTADLTVDVDFGYLKQQVQEKLVTYGPVTQSSFLINMGIEFRLANLLKHCTCEEQKSLISGYKMLTEPQQMGERFKFLAFYPAVVRDFLIRYPPAGFYRNLEGHV
ncbi:protein arginine methyltransferase NDUFAF7, mitochondrial isoform X1 [Panulirus ornatus]|uniref:protein arginine methyltransferase NDUFAF7, mitochondrial isoform X1 n=2 Tax=Panulirus ornatus TaxID=150431 RepID=UPI003A879211